MSSRRKAGGNENQDIWSALGSLATGLAEVVAFGQEMVSELKSNEAARARENASTRSQFSDSSNSLPMLGSSSFNDPTPSTSSWLQARYESSPDNIITIAVDATPTRAGGLLLLPKTKCIYFYSIDWASVFSFPNEPDKFEMVNALLAMEIFQSYVARYKSQYRSDALHLKTDNNFCTSSSINGAYPGIQNAEYRKLYQTLNVMLTTEPFSGTWKYASKFTGDKHITMADKLSRLDCSDSSSLPEIPGDGDPFSEFYFEVNVSKTDFNKIYSVTRQVPNEWLRAGQCKTPKNDEVDGWKLLAAVGGGLLVGGAIGYGIYRAAQGNQNENQHSAAASGMQDYDYDDNDPYLQQSPRRDYELDTGSSTSYIETLNNREPIIIAVGATERIAGGLLILPRTKTIHFYSIYWADIFRFPESGEPDKFEMVNALLALEIFEDYVSAYRRDSANARREPLFVKTDNTFCTSTLARRAYPGLRNGEYRRLLQTINGKLEAEPFSGEWNYLGGTARVDAHMKMANKLSRGAYSSAASLPPLEYGWMDAFEDYEQINISQSDYAVVHYVALQIPDELQK